MYLQNLVNQNELWSKTTLSNAQLDIYATQREIQLNRYLFHFLNMDKLLTVYREDEKFYRTSETQLGITCKGHETVSIRR